MHQAAIAEATVGKTCPRWTSSRASSKSAKGKVFARKIAQSRDVTNASLQFFGRPCERFGGVVLWARSKKKSAPQVKYFRRRRRKPCAKPSIHTNGQETTKTFQRKMFHQDHSRTETRNKAASQSFIITILISAQGEPTLRHENLVRQALSRSYSDLEARK